jgi:hypothetical protein
MTFMKTRRPKGSLPPMTFNPDSEIFRIGLGVGEKRSTPLSRNGKENAAPADPMLPAMDGMEEAMLKQAAHWNSKGMEQQPQVPSASKTHYSGAERQSLDGRYYDTGARGKEGPRVRAAKDARLKERIYFYVDAGKGITPEQGVGPVPHSVKLDNVYDANADTWVQAKVGKHETNDEWFNAFESAVIDNGFDGYVSDFGTQRAAVLLGRHSVAVRPGTAATPSAPAKKAAPNPITESRALPAGRMPGAEWKRLLQVVLPNADLSALEDGKNYYKDDVAREVKLSAGRQPVFYSQLAKAIEQAPDRMFITGTQVKMWLAKNAPQLGIKKDEIQWTGTHPLSPASVTRWMANGLLHYINEKAASEAAFKEVWSLGQFQKFTPITSAETGVPVAEQSLDQAQLKSATDLSVAKGLRRGQAARPQRQQPGAVPPI